MPKSQERFARQYLYSPPSEFPLTSAYPGKVRHLSGPSGGAHTQIFRQRLQIGRCCIPPWRQDSHLSALRRLHLHLRMGVFRPTTRAAVRLLGPCFKTGRWKPIRHHPERADRQPAPAFDSDQRRIAEARALLSMDFLGPARGISAGLNRSCLAAGALPSPQHFPARQTDDGHPAR